MIRLDDIDLESHEIFIKDLSLKRGSRRITCEDLPDGPGWKVVGLMASDAAPTESQGMINQFVLVVFVRQKNSAGYR